MPGLSPGTYFGPSIDWNSTEAGTNPDGAQVGYAGWDSSGNPVVYSAPAGTETPIGSVIAWLKSYANTPALPTNFVEMNGQTLSDGASVYDGQVIPDLNGNSNFLRGATTSGGTGGGSTHTHSIGTSGSPHGTGSNNPTSNVTVTGSGSNLPDYYEVVWILRIK